MRLRLLSGQRPRRADLALDRSDGLARRFPDRGRDAGDVRARVGAPAERLDARRDATLVVLRLGQMLAQPLLVGLLLGQRDMGGQVRLELGLLGVGLAQPLRDFAVTFIHLSHWLAPFSVFVQPGALLVRSSRCAADSTVSRCLWVLS